MKNAKKRKVATHFVTYLRDMLKVSGVALLGAGIR